MKRNYVLMFTLCMLVCTCVGVRLLFFGNKSRTYRIGAIYPMTGMAASMGSEFERGARLAISDAKNKGVDIELIVEDSKTEAKTAVSAYHALRARGIDAVLTTVTGCASAIIPMAKMDGVVLFADVAKPQITREYQFLFRHSSTAEQEADVMFNHVVSNQCKTVLLFWMHDEYCLALRDRLLSSRGHMIKINDVAFDKEQNIESIVSKALLGQPFDAIVVVGFGAPLGNIIKASREFGFKGDILANMGLMVTSDAREAAGESIHGVFYTNMNFDRSDIEYADYCERYKDKFGAEPNDYSLLAYNSTLLLAKVAEHNLYSAEDARTFLLDLHSVKSAGEMLTITSDRDILPPVVLSCYQ